MSDKIRRFMDGSIEAIASIRAGFLFAFLGMIAQVTHIWLLAYDFSSFSGWGATIQAWILSLFLGGGLLFFTVRAGNPGTGAARVRNERRYERIANAFAVFEAFINLYYWGDKIVFQPGFASGTFDPNIVEWYKLFIAIPFAIAIPVILKQYAGEIKLDENGDKVIQDTSGLNSQITTLEASIDQLDTRLDTAVQQHKTMYSTLGSKLHKVEEKLANVPIGADFNKDGLPHAQDIPRPINYNKK